MNKAYLATPKGKQVVFKISKYSTGSNCLKVKFVDYGEDYKIKIINNRSSSYEVIDVCVVTYGEDVKIKKVNYNQDFEVYVY